MSSEAGGNYVHGHHSSVLSSHNWRNAQNSCPHLIPHIKPTDSILDVGCGPAAISVSLAKLVPHGHVTGLDTKIIASARSHAESENVKNVSFTPGDANALPFADDTFDIVHAHQVIQYLPDPVRGLSEMIRVTKPGGIIAVREADNEMQIWYPSSVEMDEWRRVYVTMVRKNGGEPCAGRRLLSWCISAGIPRGDITCTTSCWTYSTEDERDWWGRSMADRIVMSEFAQNAKELSLADDEKLEQMAQAWRDWAKKEDGCYLCPSVEVVCKKLKLKV